MTCVLDELNESKNAESRLYASVWEDGWWCTIRLCDACRQKSSARSSWSGMKTQTRRTKSIKGDVLDANNNQGNMRV
jgi:hypothetical protein